MMASVFVERCVIFGLIQLLYACEYGKCPKISYTKVFDKYSICIWPLLSDRRSSLIRVYPVCHSTKNFKKQLHKKKNEAKKVRNKVFEILENFQYTEISDISSICTIVLILYYQH